MNQKLTSRSRYFKLVLAFALICILSLASFSSRSANPRKPKYSRSLESQPIFTANAESAGVPVTPDQTTIVGRFKSAPKSSLSSALSLAAVPLLVGDFSISRSPSSRTVNQGGTATFTITVQSSGGFNSAVSLFALNLPGNQVLPGTGFSPQTVTPPANGSTTSTLTIVTNSQTPTGTFTVTVQGQGGGLTRSTTVSLTVNGPDFTVSRSPSSRTITQGQSTSFSITVTSVNGFSGSVSLFALNLPGNVVLAGTGFSPQTVNVPSGGSATSTFNYVSNTTVPTGTFTVTIQGQGGGLTRSTTVSLTVNPTPTPNFTISASPSSRTITQGQSASYTITVTSLDGFSGSVSLFALNLPGSLVLAGTGFSPQTVNVPSGGSATSTFNYVSNTTVPTGTFTVTMQGQGGGLTRSTTVSLTINPAPTPDFTVSASPSSRTIAQGQTTTYAITVTSVNGFGGSVSLVALNLPGNVVLAGTGFSPQTVSVPSGGSATSTFTYVSNTTVPAGTFTVTMQGQGSGLTRGSNVMLTVNSAADFTVNALPSSKTITQGQTTTFTITVTSVNGFSGSVSLTALNLPGNVVLAGTGFSPQTVSVPSGGSATSTFSYLSNTTVPTGTFTVTMQGQGGALLRSTTINLTVNPSPNQDFSVSATPSARTVNQGGIVTYTVNVPSISGFSGTVGLFAINLPNNQVLPGTGFAPQTITPPVNGSATSTLSIATDAATPTGTFVITIEARGGGVTRSTSITLTVNPQQPTFTVSANPTARTVTQGNTATYTITVQSTGGFNSPIGLFAVNLPNDQVLPGTGFSPQTITPPANGSTTSILNIATNAATPLGPFITTIEARSGNLTQSTTVNLTINQAVPTSPLQVMGLEVTQGIQDLRNSVPLVQDKRTFARIHVRSFIGIVGPVQAQLIGTRILNPGANETRVPLGVISPSNPGRTLLMFQEPAPRRANLNDSFYFELPGAPQDWRQGTVELEFQGVSHAFFCNNSNSDDCKKVRVTFDSLPAASVRFVGIIWEENGKKYVPGPVDFERAAHQIESLYPIPRLNRDYPANIDANRLFSGRPTTQEDFIKILQELLRNQSLGGCVPPPQGSCMRSDIGIVLPPEGIPEPDGVLGVGSRPGTVAAGYVTPSFTVPHEFGHNLGRGHTAGCQDPSDLENDYQPPDGSISLDKTDSGFFGFDIFNISESGVYRPYTHDVMSYCRPRWMSPYTYLKLKDAVRSRFDSATTSSAVSKEQTRLVTAGNPAVVVTGSVSSSGLTGAIASVYTIVSATSISAPSSGAFAIRFLDSQGQELSLFSFQPQAQSEGTTELFNLILPWNPKTARIVLVNNGQELASRQATNNPPGISVDYPNGGETLSGSNAIVRWSASDPDGDQLSYVVQYSADAGATWQTLASDWPSSTYDMSVSSIAGSTQGIVRVLASDGFSTAQAQSNATFIVNKHLPQATIRSPLVNELYVGDQTIILEGSGYDADDGQLGNASLGWSSNLDGPLGTGQSLSVNASNLTEGTHTINLSARDSDGQSGGASITILVSRTRPTLPANLSVLPNTLNFLVGLGNVQTAPDVIAVRNNGDGALGWSASVDQGWINLSAMAGAAPSNISVSADASGLPVGQYIGHVNIATSNAPNSPQIVTITLNVAAAYIGGRVSDPTGTGVHGITLTLSGTQTGTAQTDASGNYSLGGLSAGGSITVTPSKMNYTFVPPNQTLNNVSGNHIVSFTAKLNPGVPILISTANSTRALAVESVLWTAEPFQFTNPFSWGTDRRTRIMLFVTNFDLLPNEGTSAITVEAEDAAHRVYPLAVEYVGRAPGFDWLNCVVVKVHDDIGDVGDVLVRITYRGIPSNRVRVGIGHNGGGLPDDIGAVPTPGRPPQ